MKAAKKQVKWAVKIAPVDPSSLEEVALCKAQQAVFDRYPLISDITDPASIIDDCARDTHDGIDWIDEFPQGVSVYIFVDREPSPHRRAPRALVELRRTSLTIHNYSTNYT